MSLCPVNFKVFDSINKKTKDLEATILFSKLTFINQKSKIIKLGKKWVVLSREQIASWFGFGIKKVDKYLNLLEKLNLIEKHCSLWYGKKKLFISIIDMHSVVPINFKLLDLLVTELGNIKLALVFTKIAYAFANTKIIHDHKKWCCLNKELLTKWSNLSLRTLDRIIDELIKRSFILKKKFSWNNKTQSHFHVPEFVIQVFKQAANKSIKESQKCLTEKSQIDTKRSAKKELSINKETNKKKNNNINFLEKNSTEVDSLKETIRLRVKFLIDKKEVRISSPTEIIEQIHFSITNNEQHKNIESIKHKMNRCFKILKDGRWTTPYGFNKCSQLNKLEENNKIVTICNIQQNCEITNNRNSLNIEMVKQINMLKNKLIFNGANNSVLK